VPIGDRACRWVEKYLYAVRSGYVEAEDSGTLFLAKHGEAMQGKQLSVIVKKAIEAAALDRFKDTLRAIAHLSSGQILSRGRQDFVGLIFGTV